MSRCSKCDGCTSQWFGKPNWCKDSECPHALEVTICDENSYEIVDPRTAGEEA